MEKFGNLLEGLRPAVIAVLTNTDSLQTDSERAASLGADIVELRLDGALAAGNTDPGKLITQARAGGLPVLATVRTSEEGGQFQASSKDGGDGGAGGAAGRDGSAGGAGGSGVSYREIIEEIVSASPAAVDIEFAREGSAELAAHAAGRGVYPVFSRHYFTHTPPAHNLLQTLRAMHQAGGSALKIAVMPRGWSDVLELFQATNEATEFTVPVITMAMGDLGRITRLGAFGSAATYAALGQQPGQQSAPGQLALPDLVRTIDALYQV